MTSTGYPSFTSYVGHIDQCVMGFSFWQRFGTSQNGSFGTDISAIVITKWVSSITPKVRAVFFF